MQDTGSIDCDGWSTIHASRIREGERLYSGAFLSVLPVMESVERNEAAHLGLLNPT